ncbi:MAG: glycosyltransferase family 4 protein, partial [Candidatus Omnitrophica bacterium]|nr:glycosyltransferase family 4 protein [Candidatus Omnitrophota bacterium]
FIELALHMNDYDKTIITSLLGSELCKMKGLKANFIVTTKEKTFKNIIFTYLLRTVKALLVKLDKEYRNKILYATSDFLPDVLPAFWQKLKDKQAHWVQRIYHLIPTKRPIPNLAQRLSFFLIKRYADLVIVDNCLLKDELIRRGFKEKSVRVNYLGIDIASFNKINSLYFQYEAVFLGRLHPSKGIFDLVKIWQVVTKDIPAAKLAVIGSGDKKFTEKFTKEIEKARLKKNIILFGHQTGQEKIKIMKSAKVFVFPSHEEGFGIAICEAMACGLPIIAWDLAVYKEIYQDNIIYVKENEINSFAQEILSLVKDEYRLKNISNSIKEFVVRFDYSQTIQKEIELLN